MNMQSSSCHFQRVICRAALVFSAALLMGLSSSAILHGQDAEPVAAEGTTVSSSRFRLDLQKKEGVFSGEVRVQDPGFNITCEELIAYFNEANQLQRLVARGKVAIEQGGKRNATCREAEYIVSEKSLRLTGDPVITQEGNQITGTFIKIHTEEDRMEVEGRSKVQFFLP